MRFLSHTWSVARGKVGGIVYTANQFHQLIARVYTSPVHPNTTAQGQVKQAFSSAAVGWKALTDQERTDWGTYAATLTYSNPLGPVDMPGRQVMMGNIGFLLYLQMRGVTFTTQAQVAPLIPGFLAMDPLSIGVAGAASTGFTVNVGNPNSEDMFAIIEISRRFDGSRLTYQGPFLTASLVSLPVETLTTGNQGFVLGADDDVFFVRIRSIVDDGAKRLSQPVILRAVVTTTV